MNLKGTRGGRKGLHKRIFNPIKREYSDLKNLNIKGEMAIQKEVSKFLPKLVHSIRYMALRYLTSYAESDTSRRHPTIEKAFGILEEILGFIYNKDGSFTKQGAEDQFEEDVKISQDEGFVEIEVTGRLENMHNSITDWGALRAFFYNSHFMNYIYDNYSDASQFYADLKSLFSIGYDPTEPNGRPYIFLAAQKKADTIDQQIITSIMDAFGKGEWVRTGK